MPDRYGGGGDYSQTFAYLAQTYQNNLEQQAEAANARRESEQAAKDTEVFARYDAGKLSGSALLAYIRQRINQTAYDPKQQAEWKKALLEYTESINDASALAAFERSNDYNGYLDYLRGKLTASKGNPTKAAQIQQQINQLTDERDSKSVTRGAERIMLAIAKGDKTNADLLRFYRDAIKNTRKGSSIRDQVRGQITNLVQKVRADNLTLQRTQLDAKLSSGDINVNEWGRQLKRLAESSNLDQMDPNAYASWMADANKAINTVIDTGRLEEIDGMLQRKEITPQQAERMYYKEADRYRVVDPSLYNQIRNKGYELGHTPIPGQTPLPNPGVLGLPDGYTPNQTQAQPYSGGAEYTLKWISQLDGSEFAQVNCVMGASAMLAYAMGYREKGGGIISGGDIRYLTGDREMGTNLDQAEYALGRLGINGLRNFNDKHISFDEFKKRVGERGMPAVLMGVYNNMPAGLRPGYQLRRGHGIFIAAYDEKANKFLVMDPAYSKRSHPDYKGEWMDASVVRNFGWGPSFTDSTGTYSFNGQALFAPPGTIKGRLRVGDVTNRQSNVKLHYVSVDDPPVRRQTPKNWSGLNHSGFSPNQAVGHPATDKRGKPRVTSGRRAVDENTPDTVEEVMKSLNEGMDRLSTYSEISQAYAKGLDQYNGTHLTPDLMRAFDRDVLDIYEASKTPFESLKDRSTGFFAVDGAAQLWNDFTKSKAGFVQDIAARLNYESTRINDLAPAYAKGVQDTVNSAGNQVGQGMNAIQNRQVDRAARVVDAAGKVLADAQAQVPEIQRQNSLTAEYIINVSVKDAEEAWGIAANDPDPDAAIKAIDGLRARFYALRTALMLSQATPSPLDDLSTDPKAPGSVQRIDAIIAAIDLAGTPGDPNPAERMGPIQDALAAAGGEEPTKTGEGDALGRLVTKMAEQRIAQDLIDAGTHVRVLNGQDGKWTIKPVSERPDPNTGEVTQVPMTGETDEYGRPIEAMLVPVQTPSGLQFTWAVPGRAQYGISLSAKKLVRDLKDANGSFDVNPGPIGEDMLQRLSGMGVLEQMVRSQQLEVVPLYQPMLATPDIVTSGGKIIKGVTHYGLERGGKIAWYTGPRPAKDFGIVNGYTPVGPDGDPEYTYNPYASYGMTPTPFIGDRNFMQKEWENGRVPFDPSTMLVLGQDGKPSDDVRFSPRFATVIDASGWNRANPRAAEQSRQAEIERAVNRMLEDIGRLDRSANAPGGTVTIDTDPDPIAKYTPFVASRPEKPSVPGVKAPPMESGLYDEWMRETGGKVDWNEWFDSRGKPQWQPTVAGRPDIPQAPQVGFGFGGGNKPSPGPSPDQSGDLAEMAKRLGVRVNIDTPKGPVGPNYNPPSPRNVQQQPKPKQSSLPKIGSSVMVGGTRIDVPGSKPQSKPAPGFKIPSAPKVGGGSAAQATLDRVKREVTSPTQTGNY